MDIRYLGHSSFKISGKQSSVVTDPFSEKDLGFPYPEVSASVVTVSHDHTDHNQYKRVRGVKKVFSAPGMYEVESVSFLGLPSFHDDAGGQKRGKNTIFVIEMDGVRIAHLGDLGHDLSQGDIDKLGEVDVVFVPVGGVYTIGPRQAAEITRRIDPKITIPMHYKTKGINEEIFGALSEVDEFVREIGLEKKMEKKLTIKQGSLLPEENQLVIFDGRQA